MQPMPTEMYDLPEIEYLDGRPYPKVSPRLTHALVQGALLNIVSRCAGDRGVVVPELRLDPGRIDATKTEFVPDVAYIDYARLEQLEAETRQKPPFSPEIAIEVRSPSDDLKFLSNKIQRYLRTGSLLALDVDPEKRTIHAHSKTSVREYRAGDTFEHAEAPWLTFPVSEIFAKVDALSK